jgi:hypothetical protein
LTSLPDIELTDCCTKFDKTFSFDNSSDVDLNDLISELKVLQLTLPDTQMSAMKILSLLEKWAVILTFLLLIKSYLLCL